MWLRQKTAIVLGAGGKHNMGQSIARRYAAEGARVVVSGRNTDTLHELAEEVGGLAIACDITRRGRIEQLARQTIDRFGKIDIAVNCTGLNLGRPFLETSDDDLARLYDIQFRGPFQFMQVMVKAMQHGGSIIQISSAASAIMLDDYAAYRATKAAIDQVVRSVAEEIGAAALWLASDECFMTGENLQINGGLMLRRNPTKGEVAAAMARTPTTLAK